VARDSKGDSNMSKRKSKRQNQRNQRKQRSRPSESSANRAPVWTTRHTVIALVLVLGGVAVIGLGATVLSLSSDEETPRASESRDPEGTVDQYGRSPGDPHYGHSHP